MALPTPHGDKLRALLENQKLPAGDRDRVEQLIRRYEDWLAELNRVPGDKQELISGMVEALDRYKRSVDVDLIFDSPDDFLYRQKGQLKLDNTVVEEFLPWLISRALAPQLKDRGLGLGPTNCFSHLRFDSGLTTLMPGGGIALRSKDQDFAISRAVFLKASHSQDFEDAKVQKTAIAYVAAEIKTNLDKTMFQEAAATAYDLKLAVPNAKYFLLCEWLDMTPITTAVTAIEEVLVLRKAKRLSSNVRSGFSTAAGRAAGRTAFLEYLDAHPFSADAFGRFVSHIESLLGDDEEEEEAVLGRGWF